MEKELKIVIKQIPNPDNPDVGIKYVGAKEYATPKVGRDGKVVTGVDEHSLEITMLGEKEAKTKSAEIKKLRENLEKVLNVDLKPDSSFWNEFMIVLEDEITLDPLNPRDKLHELFLVANRYVAPSLEEIKNSENYANSMFYLYRQEEEITKKAKRQRDKDKATARLFNLNEDDPNKLKMIASYLFGFDAKSDISLEEAYIKLKDFLDASDEDAQKKNIEAFLEACQKSPETILTKQIFDKAIKKRLITSRGNVFRRGDEVYGNNYEDALDFLGLPEHSGELASLKKAVEL
jgi:hypothetical protein